MKVGAGMALPQELCLQPGAPQGFCVVCANPMLRSRGWRGPQVMHQCRQAPPAPRDLWVYSWICPRFWEPSQVGRRSGGRQVMLAPWLSERWSCWSWSSSHLLPALHRWLSLAPCVPTLPGIFKIEDSAQVARLWGIRKNRPAMNYDKLSRSIRQYYRKGIIRKPDISQRLVYQFVQPI